MNDIVERLRMRSMALRSVTRQTATTKYDAELSLESADIIASLRQELAESKSAHAECIKRNIGLAGRHPHYIGDRNHD